MFPNSVRLRNLLLVSVILLATSGALADISQIIFRIEATNIAGGGSFEATIDDLIFNPVTGTWTWNQLTPIPLMSGGETIATLQSANLSLRADPQINLGFVVQAGTTETTFVIQSALLSFPVIPASVAEARASASFSVTDADGDGALLTGLGPPGSGAYLAQYNGFVPAGTTFASLVHSVSAGPGGSGGGFQNYPPVGYLDIPDDVYDMSAQNGFTLTANDLASGTSNYEIIPEPVGLALMICGALALLRRR